MRASSILRRASDSALDASWSVTESQGHLTQGRASPDSAAYLNYKGNCQEAFRFYEQHLGGKITMMMTNGEGPNPTSGPPNWKHGLLAGDDRHPLYVWVPPA